MALFSRIALLGDCCSRLALCAVLAISMSACAVTGRPEATPSSPTTAEPVFLVDETLCEAVSHQLLKDELSFQVEDYTYEHKAFIDQNGENADTFNCNLYGQQSPPGSRYGLRIGYAPKGKLNANSNGGHFSDLDSLEMKSLTFEGIEGRGYVWLRQDNSHLSAAWLYTDNHALEITLFPETDLKHTYDDTTVRGMRTLLKELIVAIPPVAAGPDRSFTFVPNPHDPQDAARRRTSTATP